MPRPPTPNTAEVEMIFVLDGQTVENVFHVTAGDPFGVPELEDLAEAFRDWWDVQMQGGAPQTLSLVKIVATALDTATSPSIEFTTGLPLTGTNADPALPNHVTVAIRHLTGLRGRSFRGRTYHLQLTEPAVAGNTINTTTANNLKAAYENLVASIPVLDPLEQLCVLSETSGGQPRAQGICTPITGIFVDTTVDSQRRRLPGRGR